MTLAAYQLWCWIGDNYNQLRIFTYYLPIWMCTVLSAVIYVAVGYHVFHQRNQLRNLTLSNQAKDGPGTELRCSSEKVRVAIFSLTVGLFTSNSLSYFVLPDTNPDSLCSPNRTTKPATRL